MTDPIVVHAAFVSARHFPLVSSPSSSGCYWFLGGRSWRQTLDGDFVSDDPHPDTRVISLLGGPKLMATDASFIHIY